MMTRHHQPSCNCRSSPPKRDALFPLEFQSRHSSEVATLVSKKHNTARLGPKRPFHQGRKQGRKLHQFRRSNLGSIPEYKDLLCAAGQTQSITKNLGGGNLTVTYSPTLIDGVSPLAPIERMRKEFGAGKSFAVTATVGGTAVVGNVTVKEVAPTLAYQDKTVKADIAYEFINDFPGGAYKVGLPKRQVFFIDATKKQIIAIINEDDVIDDNSGKVRPPAVLVRD